jgi:hypothetical protein
MTGDRALAGEPHALRDCRASFGQDGRARSGVAARHPCDIAGVDETIDKANGPGVGQAKDLTEGLNGPPGREVDERNQGGCGGFVKLRGCGRRLVHAINQAPR